MSRVGNINLRQLAFVEIKPISFHFINGAGLPLATSITHFDLGRI